MTDYKALFEHYKVPFFTNKNRGWINVACPYCGSHDNLGFCIEDDYASCWSCGWHPVEEALTQILHVPQNVIHSIIANYHKGGVIKTKNAHSTKLNFPGVEFIENEIAYLKKRRFVPQELTNVFGIMGGGRLGRWSYRIIIPLYFQGKLISWTGRSILDKDICEKMNIPRYYNLSIEESADDPRNYWFNFDNATDDYVFITEGPLDACRLGNNCISGWGSTITESQKLKLYKRYKQVFILFDNDKTGWLKAGKLKGELNALGVDAEVVNDYLGQTKDPGDLRPYRAKELKQAVLHDYGISDTYEVETKT